MNWGWHSFLIQISLKSLLRRAKSSTFPASTFRDSWYEAYVELASIWLISGNGTWYVKHLNLTFGFWLSPESVPYELWMNWTLRSQTWLAVQKSLSCSVSCLSALLGLKLASLLWESVVRVLRSSLFWLKRELGRVSRPGCCPLSGCVWSVFIFFVSVLLLDYLAWFKVIVVSFLAWLFPSFLAMISLIYTRIQ